MDSQLFTYYLCISRSFNPQTLPQGFKKCQEETPDYEIVESIL